MRGRSLLRAQGLLRVIYEWEAAHGVITTPELQAAAENALPKPRRKSTGKRRRPR